MGKVNGLKSTTYVIHCQKCKRLVKKDDLDSIEDMPCPPEKTEEEKAAFADRLAAGDVALPFIPDYKKGENYPQVAPNLPGDGRVTSYDDYKTKCKAAGIEEVGASYESRYRNKCRKKVDGLNKDGTWDMRVDRLKKAGIDLT